MRKPYTEKPVGMAKSGTRTTPDAGDHGDPPPTSDRDADGAASCGDVLPQFLTQLNIFLLCKSVIMLFNIFPENRKLMSTQKPARGCLQQLYS